MARIRTVKPELWSDEKLGSLPRGVRLTFIGLISACADDEGRFKAHPRVVLTRIYPMDEGLSADDLQAELLALVDAGIVRLYEVHGERYGVLVNWARHQRIQKKFPSRLPAPPWETEHRPATASAGTTEDRIAGCAQPGRESKTSKDNESTVSRTSHTPVEDTSRSSPPRIPAGAEAEAELELEVESESGTWTAEQSRLSRSLARFIDTYYPRSAPARRAEVIRQLTQLARGEAIMYKGREVRAKSAAHLDQAAEDVLRRETRIRDPDKAIAFLAMKLEDPVRDSAGRLPSEAAAEAGKKRERELDAYEAARRTAIREWSTVNEVDSQELRQRVDAAVPADLAASERRAVAFGRYNEEVVARIGFPDFEDWLGGAPKA